MSSTVLFAGSLDFLNLGELLQLLGANGSSGILRIISQHATEPGLVYIEKGNPINAVNGSLQGLDALFSLFGWTEGQFEFTREPLGVEKRITKSRMEIVLDGLRLLDEGKIKKLGTVPSDTKAPGEAPRSGKIPFVKGPLVDYSYVIDEEMFYNGDEIVREGNHGTWMWVVLEGIVEITKESSTGATRLIRLGDGAFLGSAAALLAGDNVRNATAVAVGNVQLGMLDTQLLSSELANLSNDFKYLIQTLDNRLRDVSTIAVNIQKRMSEFNKEIKNKKPVLKQGQEEDRLFRVARGEAFIVRQSDNARVPLTRVGKGFHFGKVPFLDFGHEPYSASVFASEGLKVNTVNVQALQKEHDALSATLKNILAHVAACISVTTLVACEHAKSETTNLN